MQKPHFVKYVLVLVLILAISIWLILLANGYKINYQTYKLEKTGMIYLSSTPAEAQVFINGQLKATKTPYKLSNIFPGRYDIKLTAVGFHDWQETLRVEAEMTAERRSIILFLLTPQEIPLNDNEKANYLAQFSSPESSQNKGLFIKAGNEIWFSDIFITRLSQNIEKVAWLYDKKHILYQAGQAIFVMDVGGSNIIELVALKNSGTVNFISTDNGETLVYQDGQGLHKIKITQNNGFIDSLRPNILK